MFIFELNNMGLWAKAKGFFGRIGRGIKNGATKAYNWITNNKDKIQKGVDMFNQATNNKYSDTINKGQGYINQGMNIAGKLGLGG